MNINKIVLLTLTLLLTACGGSVTQNDNPAKIAESFWDAMRMGDRARAEELAVPGSMEGASMDFDSPGNDIESLTFAVAMVSEDKAAVPTTMVGELSHRPVQFSFDTRLVLTDDGWRVDFDTTRTGMMGAMLKQAMSTFGEVMVEGVQEAMSSIGETLSTSVDVLGEGMKEGFKQGAAGMVEGLDSASEAMRSRTIFSAPRPMPARVSGEIQGTSVQLLAAEWDNSVVIYQGESWVDGPSIRLFLFLPEGQLPAERTISVVSNDNAFDAPHVHYRWRNTAGDIESRIVTEGYNLTLEFSAATAGRVEGVIRFDIPGEGTRLAGDFSLHLAQ